MDNDDRDLTSKHSAFKEAKNSALEDETQNNNTESVEDPADGSKLPTLPREITTMSDSGDSNFSDGYQERVSKYWENEFRRSSLCKSATSDFGESDTFEERNELSSRENKDLLETQSTTEFSDEKEAYKMDSLPDQVPSRQNGIVDSHPTHEKATLTNPENSSEIHRNGVFCYEHEANGKAFFQASNSSGMDKVLPRQTSQPGAVWEDGPGLESTTRRNSAEEEVLAAFGLNTNQHQSFTNESRMSSRESQSDSRHPYDVNMENQETNNPLPTASVVDNAVTIPQAQQVRKVVRPKPNQIIIVLFGILACGGLLTYYISSHTKHGSKLGDARCWLPVHKQSVPIQCYCKGTAIAAVESLWDADSEKFIQVLLENDVDVPKISDLESGSCEPRHQALLLIAQSQISKFDLHFQVNITPPEAVVNIYVLAYLYVTMGGIDWVNSQNWFTTTAYCNWNGLTCGFLGFVSQVSFRSFELKGSIPSEIGYLRSLQQLDFSYNDGITGTIPSQIAKMVSLHAIDLAHTQLTGTIPSELGRLERLRSIYLNSNQLTGSIPSELFMVGRGRVLEFDVSANDLTGTIPSTIGLLTDLSHFKVSNNSITGTLPWEMGELKSLELLGVANNKFSGLIPTELGMCPLLKYIALYRSGFVGSIPEELCMGSNSSDNVLQGKFRHLVIECTGKADESDLCSCCSTNILSGAYVRVSCAESIPAHELGLVF